MATDKTFLEAFAGAGPGRRPERRQPVGRASSIFAWMVLGIRILTESDLQAQSLAPPPEPPGALSVGSRIVAPCPDERQLFDDLRDGRLDRFGLIQAALVAAGECTAAEAEHFEQAWRSRCQELIRRADQQAANAPDRPRELLALLHQRVLTGAYQREASQVCPAMQGGDYNCLSASTLYLSLLRQAGYQAVAIELPSHVRIAVQLGDARIELESTSPRGEPAHQTQAGARAERPPRGRGLTDRELVGAVFYNRGCRALDQGEFAEAILASRVAWQLDPAAERARQNAVAACNRWAARSVAQRAYGDAAQLLLMAQAWQPDHPGLTENLRCVLGRWAVEFGAPRCGGRTTAGSAAPLARDPLARP